MTPRRSSVYSDRRAPGPAPRGTGPHSSRRPVLRGRPWCRGPTTDHPRSSTSRWHPASARGEPVGPWPAGRRVRTRRRRRCRPGRPARAALLEGRTSSHELQPRAVVGWCTDAREALVPGPPDRARSTPRGAASSPASGALPLVGDGHQLELLVAGDPSGQQAEQAGLGLVAGARCGWITLSPRCKASAIRAARRRSADSRSSCRSRECSGGHAGGHDSEVSRRARRTSPSATSPLGVACAFRWSGPGVRSENGRRPRPRLLQPVGKSARAFGSVSVP